MNLVFSQKEKANEWRPILRKLFVPILNTFKSKDLVTKVFFYSKGTCGHFASWYDHGYYSSDIKRLESIKGYIPRGVITLKLYHIAKPETIFHLFAHEFFHWRQSFTCKNRAKYSEMKARRWANKMTRKYHPEYYGDESET